MNSKMTGLQCRVLKRGANYIGCIIAVDQGNYMWRELSVFLRATKDDALRDAHQMAHDSIVKRFEAEAKANARLIAAAPELYGALMKCESEMRAMHLHHHPTCDGGCPYDEAASFARAALAKAKNAL